MSAIPDMNEDDSTQLFLLELAEEVYPEIPREEWEYNYGLTRRTESKNT